MTSLEGKRPDPLAKKRFDIQTVHAFIKFESIHRESVGEAYKSFCKILGDNAMKYTDFDYWYYRFKDGKFDLDHDRSTDPSTDMITRNVHWKNGRITMSAVISHVVSNIGKPPEDMYNSFMLEFGSCALKYIDFEYLSFQFLNGNFNMDYERSKDPPNWRKPADLQEFINDKIMNLERNVERAIRDYIACIRYEFLNRKPIFEAYKCFCRNFGNYAMKYKDFDYWWYRFENGQLDLDHDRSEEPPALELLDLPKCCLKELFECMDWTERVRLRMVSRYFKQLSDHTKIEFTEVCLRFHSDSAALQLRHSDRTVANVKYESNDVGCLVRQGDYGIGTVLTDTSYLDTVLRDFCLLIENKAIHIDCLKIHLNPRVSQNIRNSWITTVGARVRIAIRRNTKIQVTWFEMVARSEEEVLTILPYFKPGVLKHIQLKDCDRGVFLDINAIADTD